MSDIYYSATNNGFYHDAFREVYEASANGWPDDAQQITDELYRSLIEGQASGKMIVAGTNGAPVLADRLIDWSARAEQQRTDLLTTANSMTADWRTELELGVISDLDRSALVMWMAYIRALKSLDLSSVKDEADYNVIAWPESP
ncbi:tail fiber assembly protein [Pantoea agglomerans]|uniref:tail fiber assembly protein n=1 Tax=Enterobacter agglomerans TaxID=549 RepID=UPI003C7D0AE9